MRSKMFRKYSARLCGALTVGMAAVFSTAHSEAAAPSAENYPSKPIRIVDAFTPGGGTDVMARQIGQKLTERFKQPVIVDNRPGAGGTIGAGIAAKAAADGYTLFMAVVSSLAPSVSLYPDLPYNVMKDFAFVALVASGTYVVVVNPALPANSISELVALAKSRPGKLSYGSTGVGGPAHLVGELLNIRAGVDILAVAYKGGPAIISAITSDEVQLSYLNIATVLQLIRAGRLRGLAITAAKRVKAAPELPTVAESGLPDFDVTPWYGVLAPASTPASIVAQLNREIGSIVQLPDMLTVFQSQGLEVSLGTPAQFRQLMQAEINKWAKVIKDAGIKFK